MAFSFRKAVCSTHLVVLSYAEMIAEDSICPVLGTIFVSYSWKDIDSFYFVCTDINLNIK